MTQKHTFRKPGRDVHSVFLHCSASDHAHHDNIKTMKTWHLQRGFNGVGYHYFIRKDGTLEVGRPIDNIPAAQSGHNKGSIAICCHGLEKSKFTTQQFKRVRELCEEIQAAYSPRKLKFRGHKEVSTKSCPVYDYKAVLNLDDKGYIKPKVLPKTTQSPLPVQGSCEPQSILSMLSVSRVVNDIQLFLDMLYCKVKIDGVFGQQTRLALESAQKQCGIVVDGECSPRVLEKLVSCRRGSSGEKVIKIQTLLVKLGYEVSVDGSFGPKTEDAVKLFQKNNKLTPDGIIGTNTLKKMSALQLKA